MILDCDQYRINVRPISDLTKELTNKERYKFISNLAVITGVPIIIVCSYLLELYGPDEATIALRERLKAFYTVSEVINSKEDSWTTT